MAFLYEIFPVFLFFIVFKFYDIYAATVVGIVASFIQVVATRIFLKNWDRKQLFALGVFTVFGGMTLYFHNPIFVKWKPTIIFWVFASAILVSQFIGQKPIMEHIMGSIMEEQADIPKSAWYKLNLFWGVFFALLGMVNIYIAYHFDSNTWVNFKFYGISLALIGFSVFQAFYLMKYFDTANTGSDNE